jgi:hypothetical protein
MGDEPLLRVEIFEDGRNQMQCRHSIDVKVFCDFIKALDLVTKNMTGKSGYFRGELKAEDLEVENDV